MSAELSPVPVTGDLAVVERGSLGDLRGAWDSLVMQSPLPSPFLRSWWLDSVGTARDHYVLVLAGDVLVGGLALQRSSLPGAELFRFLGAGRLCPDHLDLVARPGHDEAVRTALRVWFRARRTRILDLRGIADGAALLDLFPDRSRADDVAPYEPLPGTIEDYLADRSGNFRRSTARAERRLVERGATFRRIAPADLDGALADLAAIHGRRGDRDGLLAELPRLNRALVAGAVRDEVRVYVAEMEGIRAAVVVAFVTAGRLGLYQLARRTDRRFSDMGTVTVMAAVRDALGSGMTEVDFLRGDERYKSGFTRHRRTLWRIRVGSGPWSGALTELWIAASWLHARSAGAFAEIREFAGSIRPFAALVGHVQSWKVGRSRRDRGRHRVSRSGRIATLPGEPGAHAAAARADGQRCTR